MISLEVPKIIHQTWKCSEVPDKWKKSPEEWKRYHPTWEYKLWTDADNRELIASKYAWFLPTYDSYPYPIQRADAVRYFILYEYGGVYSDLDLYPVKPVDDFVDGCVEAYFTFSGNYPCVTNSFMASVKGAVIWKDVFCKMAQNCPPAWTKISKHFKIMLTTGPMMLNEVVGDHLCTTVGLLPKGFRNYAVDECVNFACLKPGTVLLPLEGKSWCGFDSYVLNFVNQYKTQLAVIAIILIIVIIILLIVFIVRYSKVNKLFNKCKNRLCKKEGTCN